MNKNIAILICTHDKSKSLWRSLEQSYSKFWPDCKYNIYLSTNHENPGKSKFIPLLVGDEISWSDNILKSLDKINEDWILMTFDDVYWRCKVDAKKIDGLIQRCIDENWNYLRLHNSPKGDYYHDNQVSMISRRARYRTSTANAIFKKDVLRNLLNANENAWDFERNGSKRSCVYDKFYVVNDVTIPYYNLIVKGKMELFAKSNIEKQGIDLTDVEFERMSVFQTISRGLYVSLYRCYTSLVSFIGFHK